MPAGGRGDLYRSNPLHLMTVFIKKIDYLKHERVRDAAG